VASFLAALATRQTGLLLVLDDVQWLDATSRAVLRRLAEDFADAPLLIVATARDDDPDAVESFGTALGDRLDLRVPVGRLPDGSIAELVAGYLAGSAVSDDVMAELTTRGRGNPFTTLEYLHALVNTGALRPSWGTWQLDADRLQSVELPTDVFELVLARIGGLGEQVMDVLTLAAAVGSRFDAGLLAEIIGRDPAPALVEGCQHGVLHAGHDGYTFVHDRIRESLLSAVDPAGRRRMHQRIAVVLDARVAPDPATVYAVAGHYAQGEQDRTPDRVVATGWAAGRLASEENAPAAAVAFLEVAAAVAATSGTVLDSRFDEALAGSYLATGQAEAACERLEPALAGEAVPLRRAALQLQLAIATRMRWELSRSLEHVHSGLAELGRALPRHRAPLGLLTLGLMTRWLTTGTRRPRPRPVTGPAAERLRLELALCQAGATASAMGLQIQLTPIFILRPALAAHRLGASPEYALVYTATSMVAGVLRLRRRRDRIFRRGAALAAQIRDPKLSATLEWMHAFARAAAGDASWAEMARLIETERRWLELDYYSNVALLRTYELLSQGYAREAQDWHDRGRARLSSSTAEAFTGYDLAAAMARSLLGETPEAPAVSSDVAPGSADAGYWVHHVNAAVQVAVEQDELGTTIEDAMAVFDRLGVPTAPLFSAQRMMFVYESFGRLTQARRAPAERRAEFIPAAMTAARRLGGVANDPMLRAYHQIVEANLEELDGRPEHALARLARAERILVSLDAPLAHYEAARVRAWALHATGQEALATQQADYALLLADRHGWTRRARWIHTEWGNRSVVGGPGRRTDTYRQPPSAGGDRHGRRLAALQQVNAAAASVLDPQRLARIALDETLRIFAAERAVLFLTGADGTVQFSVGRTGDGDLNQLTGYSASLVERVGADRRPIVVTGSEEGAALGSRSAVVHGLRSIMIAPLELDGRLLGVVYLDSRVAKGVFTDQDVDVLVAVTSQIAVSLETARAAQLEVAVHAARQQRDTAEALRVAMMELTATLDPGQVLELLRNIVSRTIGADRVCLVQQDGTRLAVVGIPDGEPIERDAAELFSAAEPRSGTATDVPAGVTALLGVVRAWLTAPLNTRGGAHGVLVAGSADGDAFGVAQLDMAAALAGQGAMAYDNARLFAQVQQLATIDALTGVFNRRHFTELAGNQLTTARRNHRALAGMMVDIDHFKKVNDTYGHGTGDEVIRAVARALQSVVREPDVLCRYGGEEFALVMSEMEGDPLEIAERLRRAVADLVVPGHAGHVPLTVSVGVAELKPDDDLASLLSRADEALYRAKQAGRNLVRAG
jgi:diguanylate cyclase (GGDEF)-like protein